MSNTYVRDAHPPLSRGHYLVVPALGQPPGLGGRVKPLGRQKSKNTRTPTTHLSSRVPELNTGSSRELGRDGGKVYGAILFNRHLAVSTYIQRF